MYVIFKSERLDFFALTFTRYISTKNISQHVTKLSLVFFSAKISQHFTKKQNDYLVNMVSQETIW